MTSPARFGGAACCGDGGATGRAALVSAEVMRSSTEVCCWSRWACRSLTSLAIPVFALGALERENEHGSAALLDRELRGLHLRGDLDCGAGGIGVASGVELGATAQGQTGEMARLGQQSLRCCIAAEALADSRAATRPRLRRFRRSDAGERRIEHGPARLLFGESLVETSEVGTKVESLGGGGDDLRRSAGGWW
jgi:hypothetical protein